MYTHAIYLRFSARKRHFKAFIRGRVTEEPCSDSCHLHQLIHTLLVLDLGLHILDGVAGLDLEGDGLTGQSLHKDLHFATVTQKKRHNQYHSESMRASNISSWAASVKCTDDHSQEQKQLNIIQNYVCCWDMKITIFMPSFGNKPVSVIQWYFRDFGHAP